MELQVPAGAEMMAASDPCDQATMEEERTAILQARARDRARLQEIRAALKRIEYGDFGYCEATGEPIGMRRLLAYPTARCSLEAQQRQEHSLRFARAT
jgi:DnaK suppressor protein